MSETKHMAIKLFGKTIPLLQKEEIPAAYGDRGGDGAGAVCLDQDCFRLSKDFQGKELSNGAEKEQTEEKDPLSTLPMEIKVNEVDVTPISEVKDPATYLGINENPKTPSVDKETSTLKTSRTEEENSDTSASQEQTVKKPDKILPCPRCNSMDTKFCYYNNYNVNQPRHFCKNCQRYWTAGGTMRNVPVGAGRRKNKNSASHYQHITISEALQTARTNVPDGIHHTTLRHGGTVLTFGSDTPLCESMASVLNLAEKSKNCSTKNGFHRPEELRNPDSGGGGGNNDDDNSNKPSVGGAPNPTEGNRVGLQKPSAQNCNGFPPQIPCFPGAPWAYPWNSTQWSSSVPPPAFCASSFPIPFYHAAAYWGCAVPGAWTFPWPSPPSSAKTQAPGSGPNSPLGKHSREGEMLKASTLDKEDQLKESDSERCLWIPKTLRIDDPGEAARSSIWATLGIKNDKTESLSGGGGLFKAFQSKADEKTHMGEASPVLQANPAALSRSLKFQESS